MSPLTFSLREAPAQRLDLSPLIAQNLAGRTVAEIERIELQTTRMRVTVGDVFRMREGDPNTILIEGGAERFDRVGMGMSAGSIRVEGEVGVEAGRLMSGGQLTIRGNAGPFAGSRMKGGTLDIEGDAGERLGGPLSGETVGMSGGVLHVRGDAGERAADRLRRGFILIEGRAGAYAGSRMIAGTLAIGDEAGDLPGYLMGRGTILLGRGASLLSPSFGDCGEHDLVAARLLANYIAQVSATAGETVPPAVATSRWRPRRARQGRDFLPNPSVQFASQLLTLVVANFDQTTGQRDSFGRRPSKPVGEIVDGAPDQRKLARAKRRQTPTVIAKRQLAQSRDNRGGRRERVSDGQRRKHKDGQRQRRREIGDRGNAQPSLTHCGFRVGDGEDRPSVGLARGEGANAARLRSEHPLVDRLEPDRRLRADSFDLAAKSRRLASPGRECDADARRHEFQRGQRLPFRRWKQRLLAQAAAP